MRDAPVRSESFSRLGLSAVRKAGSRREAASRSACRRFAQQPADSAWHGVKKDGSSVRNIRDPDADDSVNDEAARIAGERRREVIDQLAGRYTDVYSPGRPDRQRSDEEEDAFEEAVWHLWREVRLRIEAAVASRSMLAAPLAAYALDNVGHIDLDKVREIREEYGIVADPSAEELLPLLHIERFPDTRDELE
jgi:hypothetical protein